VSGRSRSTRAQSRQARASPIRPDLFVALGHLEWGPFHATSAQGIPLRMERYSSNDDAKVSRLARGACFPGPGRSPLHLLRARAHRLRRSRRRRPWTPYPRPWAPRPLGSRVRRRLPGLAGRVVKASREADRSPEVGRRPVRTGLPVRRIEAPSRSEKPGGLPDRGDEPSSEACRSVESRREVDRRGQSVCPMRVVTLLGRPSGLPAHNSGRRGRERPRV
jgi:hypothetical protein